MDDFQGSEEISQEQDQKRQRQHENLQGHVYVGATRGAQAEQSNLFIKKRSVYNLTSGYTRSKVRGLNRFLPAILYSPHVPPNETG